jgi:iron complex transport system substrate-binding protein
VGRDDFSDYPAEAKAVATVGGNMGNYDNEAIVALKPDLVLMTGINTPEQVKALEELGITVFYLPNPTTLDEMYANLVTVGRLTGHAADAAALVDSLKARVKAVTDKVSVSSYRPAVFYELDGSEPSKPWTAGAGSFVDMLITLAGGENVAGGVAGGWAQFSQEELIVQNPDIILLGDAAYGVTIEAVASRPGWENINAIQNGKVYAFDDNTVSRPGPRLVDGMEAMAKLFVP